MGKPRGEGGSEENELVKGFGCCGELKEGRIGFGVEVLARSRHSLILHSVGPPSRGSPSYPASPGDGQAGRRCREGRQDIGLYQ